MIKVLIDSFVRMNICIATLFIISTNAPSSSIWYIRILGLLTIFWIFIPLIDYKKTEVKTND